MRKIKLKSNGLGRYDNVSPFLIESGALALEIYLPDKSGEYYLVSELNGKEKVQRIIRGSSVTLSDLETGELKAAVKHYLRGELIEVYKIEPLLLKAVDTQLSATPEIAFLMGECQAMREKLEAAEKSLAETEKHNRERDIALLSYAWADYQNNVQLNAKNLSLLDFAGALGYDFTKEELEQIDNKKEAF